MTPGRAVGVDVGGSYIRGAAVDLALGRVEHEPIRRDTPQQAEPEAIARIVGEIVQGCDADGAIGVTVPGVVKNDHVSLAVNLDPAWSSVDPVVLFSDATGGRQIALLNDADAAGIAEARHGAGRAVAGTVLMLTFGTGVGSALLVDGRLTPNLEVGQLPHASGVWQDVISARARRRAGHSWERWAESTNEFLTIAEAVLWPDLIIIGGGICDESERWHKLLKTQVDCVVAHNRGNAGIVGAAMAAADLDRDAVAT